MEKASYLPYREGLEPREGGGTPRPDPPGGPASSLPYKGAVFRDPGLAGGPRSLSREFWRFGSPWAPGPGGHGFFRGTPPMVSGEAGAGRGLFWGPEGSGAVFPQFWPGRNGINFSTLFRAVFAIFCLQVEVYNLGIKILL